MKLVGWATGLDIDKLMYNNRICYDEWKMLKQNRVNAVISIIGFTFLAAVALTALLTKTQG